ncbi:sensor histidine kinase [Spongiimicrobium sp. 2-473A-2-J]|uniref:sensor histidine kinase n=1 Tax=Eudoraea algarum TaxID=3417568 RepID=UPI003D35E931
MPVKSPPYYSKLPVSLTKMVLAGLLISLFFVIKAYADHLINQYNYPFSWLLITLKISINYLLWVVLTPWAYSLTKQLQKRKKNTVFTLLMVLLGSVLLAFVHQLIATRANDLVYFLESGYMKAFLGHNNLVALSIGSFSSFIELWVIIALFLALDYQKRYLHNQKELIAAQLTSLQMQLHPHFLFNTLHSISAMIDIDPRKAQRMLTKMGTLMRTLLENDVEQMTTVEKELQFIKDYLELEQIRYADKMRVQYDISQEVLPARIPNMILQPLVENAIKYGIAPAMEQGEIHIAIQKGSKQALGSPHMEVKISNSSEGAAPNVPGTGLGLKNVKKRLQGLYKDEFLFESRFIGPNHYVAQIALPLNTRP